MEAKRLHTKSRIVLELTMFEAKWVRSIVQNRLVVSPDDFDRPEEIADSKMREKLFITLDEQIKG